MQNVFGTITADAVKTLLRNLLLHSLQVLGGHEIASNFDCILDVEHLLNVISNRTRKRGPWRYLVSASSRNEDYLAPVLTNNPRSYVILHFELLKHRGREVH